MEEKKTQKIKIEMEKIPILFLYRQDGELKMEINKTDYKAYNPYELYGYLSLYLKALAQRLIGEDEEED